MSDRTSEGRKDLFRAPEKQKQRETDRQREEGKEGEKGREVKCSNEKASESEHAFYSGISVGQCLISDTQTLMKRERQLGGQN